MTNAQSFYRIGQDKSDETYFDFHVIDMSFFLTVVLVYVQKLMSTC